MLQFLNTFRPQLWELLAPITIISSCVAPETTFMFIRQFLPSVETRVKFGLIPDQSVLAGGDDDDDKAAPARQPMRFCCDGDCFSRAVGRGDLGGRAPRGKLEVMGHPPGKCMWLLHTYHVSPDASIMWLPSGLKRSSWRVNLSKFK